MYPPNYRSSYLPNLVKAAALLFAAWPFHGTSQPSGSDAMPTSMAPADPAVATDVIGRDLDLPLWFRPFGHVALYVGSGQIIEALPAQPAIQINPLADFKARTRYWGAIYYAPWSQLTDQAAQRAVQLAVVRRALEIRRIGARYTATPFMIRSRPATCHGCTAVTGLYRCDSFVKDALHAGGATQLMTGPADTPRSLWRHPSMVAR